MVPRYARTVSPTQRPSGGIPPPDGGKAARAPATLDAVAAAPEAGAPLPHRAGGPRPRLAAAARVRLGPPPPGVRDGAADAAQEGGDGTARPPRRRALPGGRRDRGRGGVRLLA